MFRKVLKSPQIGGLKRFSIYRHYFHLMLYYYHAAHDLLSSYTSITFTQASVTAVTSLNAKDNSCGFHSIQILHLLLLKRLM